MHRKQTASKADLAVSPASSGTYSSLFCWLVPFLDSFLAPLWPARSPSWPSPPGRSALACNYSAQIPGFSSLLRSSVALNPDLPPIRPSEFIFT